MARLLEAHWAVSLDASARRDQRSGRYHPYVPDDLVGRPLMFDGALGAYAAEIETAVRRLSVGEGASAVEHLARFPLRSEAIASSRIEGLHVSAQRVALAEPAQDEGIAEAKFTHDARRSIRSRTATGESAGRSSPRFSPAAA